MADTNSKFTRPGGKGVVHLLSSMKMGLFLLLLIGAASSLGSLIPQSEEAFFYKNHYGGLIGAFILLLSLNKLYSSWWFILLGAVFATNILLCSIKRLKNLNSSRAVGSVILHLSILVIFSGSLVSGLLGQSEYIELGTGESIDLATKGFPGYSLHVKDFKIEYYDTLEPKQYVSKLTLASEKDEVNSEISVNHPLKAEGFTIYQQSYGWKVKGQIDVGGKEQQFDLVNGADVIVKEDIKMRVIYVPDFDPSSGNLHSRSPLPNNPHLACAIMQNDQLIAVEVIPQGATKEVAGYPVTFSGYGYYTGLEVKQDPGVKIVYTGFVLIVIGFLIRYFAPLKTTQKSEVGL